MNNLLPPNASKMERALAALATEIRGVPRPVYEIEDPDKCPVDLLPWLAWAYSIDSWQSYWPEHVKRARIRSAIEIQRHKGTAQSIRDVIETFGGAVVLTEWWQMDPPGQPHTFSMVLTLSGQGGQTATAQYVNDVIDEVSRTKPVRSHFTFTQGVNLAAHIGVAAFTRPCVFVRLSLTGSL